MMEFSESIKDLNSREKSSLVKELAFKNIQRELSGYNVRLDERPYRPSRVDSIEKYDFEIVMNNIRNIIAHRGISEETDFESIEWLIKILIKNPSLFSSVKEVDNFLSNTTGLKHATKSTGRDRIVDWYFKEMHKKYPELHRNRLLEKITKYIFITLSSNHKEWTKLLLKIKGQ